MKMLWRYPSFCPVTFILFHSASLCLHLPPAQNTLAGAPKPAEFLIRSRPRRVRSPLTGAQAACELPLLPVRTAR